MKRSSRRSPRRLTNFSMRAVRTGEAIGPGVRQQYARSSSTVKRVAVAEKSMAQLHLLFRLRLGSLYSSISDGLAVMMRASLDAHVLVATVTS